jgi:hypothetical protein
MSQILVVLLAVAAAAAIFLVFSGALGSLEGTTPSAPAPQPVVESPLPAPVPVLQPILNKIKLEIATVSVWDSAVADIPLWLTGQPREIEFVIKFPPHLVRVSRVESSANWDMQIERSNERGEVVVRAQQIRSSPGPQRFLTLRFHRLEKANAELTIPKETLRAQFAQPEPYEVEIIPGGVRIFR